MIEYKLTATKTNLSDGFVFEGGNNSKASQVSTILDNIKHDLLIATNYKNYSMNLNLIVEHLNLTIVTIEKSYVYNTEIKGENETIKATFKGKKKLIAYIESLFDTYQIR